MLPFMIPKNFLKPTLRPFVFSQRCFFGTFLNYREPFGSFVASLNNLRLR